MIRHDLDENKDYIISQLKLGVPRAQICREFRCKHETLAVRLERWGVSHLKNQSSKGIPRTKLYKPSHNYTYEGAPRIKSHDLRLKLIRDGVKQHSCEYCQTSTWMGKPVPLELHHVDGNRHNNVLDNLKIICPNCHAQTDTNSGKNAHKKKKPANTCVDCQKEISRTATRCKSCAVSKSQGTKIDWPDLRELLMELKNAPFTGVANNLGVTDNAIRKHLEKNGVDTSKLGYHSVGRDEYIETWLTESTQ